MTMSEDRFRRTLAAGEVLFREGEPGHEAFVIEEGSVEIFQERPQGRNVLAHLGRDAIFGEMALVGDQTRTASAVATEPTALTVVTHDYLSGRLSQADPLLRHLLHVTMARSRQSLLRVHSGPFEAHPLAPGAKRDTSPAALDQDLALKRLRLERDLERALTANEFQLNYQPIMRLADGSVAGFEALIRWYKPGFGRVPPGDFIWVAEDCDLIIRIGHWIIANACVDLNRFEEIYRAAAPGHPPLSMSVNLSIRQFDDAELFPTVKRVLEQEKLAANRLKLEITESLVMSNMQAAQALLGRCKALGTKLVVDDFGTGYSSLSYLHRLPVDTLKLDKSFIDEAASDGAGMKIVRAVAGLATDLSMETVIEGVENVEQASACKRAGINYAQGYWYAKPLDFDGASAFLQQPLRAVA
jgi:EAL domain-containing protein (putative c-di-GMP-specific phosphodiesterase class I)